MELIAAASFTPPTSKPIVIGGKEMNGNKGSIMNIPKISNPSELNQYYNLADLFVILSKYENLPTVCLEASATGTPIVGWDTGGTKEAAIDVDSRFYDYGDLSIVEGIIELANTAKNNNPNLNFLDKYRFTMEYYEIY